MRHISPLDATWWLVGVRGSLTFKPFSKHLHGTFRAPRLPGGTVAPIGRRGCVRRSVVQAVRNERRHVLVAAALPKSLNGVDFLEDWLNKIQQPAQVERLLEAFATRSGLLPEGVYRIRDPQALPEGLRRALTYVVASVWVCFTQGSRYWLFAGAVSPALSRLRNAPVLHVNCYCEDGALLTDVRAWTVELEGASGWRRVRSS